MWKNASGSQKRKRKKEKEWAVEAAKYKKKLDKMLFARQRAPVTGELRYVNPLVPRYHICCSVFFFK